MKVKLLQKILVGILFFASNQLLFSQEINKNITLNYNAISKLDAIEKVESISGFKFFFNPTWFDTDKTLISGNFENKNIEEVLNEILNETNLNFIIDDNKVIITKNSLVYQKLHESYYPNDKLKDNSAINTVPPVFYQEYENKVENEQNSTKPTSISLVGKEGKENKNAIYTLSGTLLNSKNKTPLKDVTVKVKNSDITTSTNSEGYFVLKVPAGLNIIETESLNHNKISKQIMMYNDGKLNFLLTDKINQLEDVTIKTKKSQNVRTVIAGITTIESEGVKNIPMVLGERDLLKIALTLPGIKTAGEGSSGFNVRGGKEDQNLILLDNAVVYNPAHFFGFFSAVNPYATSKVDIYKGGIPSDFGGRLSSVFDIVSKNGDTEIIKGEGGVGPVTSNLTISTPIVKSKSSLLLGFRTTYSGWILRSLKDSQLQNSKADFYDGILKYSHAINDKNTIESTLYYSKDSYSITSDSLYKYSNRVASIKWKNTINAKSKLELNATNSEYKFNIDYDAQNLNAFNFGYKLSENQFKLKLFYNLTEKHKLTYGVTSKLYNIKPGDFNPKYNQSLLTPVNIDSEKGLESAAFISDNFKISKKLTLDYGLRYSVFMRLGASTQRVYQNGLPKNDQTFVKEDKFQNNKVFYQQGGFEPRLAARYLITDSFSLKAGYDQTLQYIHLLSSNTTQAPTDAWKLSDTNIKPQKGQQISLGIFKNIDYNEMEFSAEGYYKKSNNILDYKIGANLLLNQNIETEVLQGEGKAYGLEFLVKKQMGRLNGWLGYTYSRTLIKLDSNFNEEKINNGEYFAANFDKPHDFSAVLNYKFTKRYSFSSNFVYQTGRPITYPIGKFQYNNAEYTVYSDRNKFRVPDYYRLDIGLNIEGNHKIKKLAHSFWNISVYNVLGRNNPFSVFFVTKDGQIKAYQTSIFAIPVPTITYNFKF